jgi:hypothetical protein
MVADTAVKIDPVYVLADKIWKPWQGSQTLCLEFQDSQNPLDKISIGNVKPLEDFLLSKV